MEKEGKGQSRLGLARVGAQVCTAQQRQCCGRDGAGYTCSTALAGSELLSPLCR